MADKKPKIYRMGDCDTVIAYSKRDAVNWYFKEGGTCENLADIAIECEREKDLSETFWWNCWEAKDLWDRAIKLKLGEEIKVSTWAGDPAYLVTFQYVLDNLLDRISIPSIICSTEF